MGMEKAMELWENFEKRPLFEKAVLASFLFHTMVWALFTLERDLFQFSDGPLTIDVDLTRPFRLVDNPLLEKKALNPGTGAPLIENPDLTPAPPSPVIKEKPTPPKEWLLPTPETKELEKPVEEQRVVVPGQGTEDSTGRGIGGLGDGTGDGEVDLIYLTEFPKLLNRKDLEKNIMNYYPPEMHRLGVESTVRLSLSIDRSGKLRRADILESGGEQFDEAALKVIEKAIFSPPKKGKKAVSTKIPMSIPFYLEDR